ncbi:Entericidin EcnA/B family protein [Malonomonas rubra DSM 5091]|uniref:Entericidin EcnA/B family protein n=1 Tax=Malonomonas rubra DSM 5091 TaxID=1122189 RepID=A0A1M6LSG3_MALRU|nr:entericidin A/B family lipoprotein [Malonomonas rubra]SHJ74113.1 Entericidin EcnA/B family protein [Malonomonas rubra DSM 5091]
MKRILALLLIAAALFISGCETFHGLGKDVEKAGEWVQEKAN